MRQGTVLIASINNTVTWCTKTVNSQEIFALRVNPSSEGKQTESYKNCLPCQNSGKYEMYLIGYRKPIVSGLLIGEKKKKKKKASQDQ